jgi:hypothetical protein
LGYRAIVRRTKDDNSISAYLFITACLQHCVPIRKS